MEMPAPLSTIRTVSLYLGILTHRKHLLRLNGNQPLNFADVANKLVCGFDFFFKLLDSNLALTAAYIIVWRVYFIILRLLITIFSILCILIQYDLQLAESCTKAYAAKSKWLVQL